jgi:hypothetical protein
MASALLQYQPVMPSGHRTVARKEVREGCRAHHKASHPFLPLSHQCGLSSSPSTSQLTPDSHALSISQCCRHTSFAYLHHITTSAPVDAGVLGNNKPSYSADIPCVAITTSISMSLRLGILVTLRSVSSQHHLL